MEERARRGNKTKQRAREQEIARAKSERGKDKASEKNAKRKIRGNECSFHQRSQKSRM